MTEPNPGESESDIDDEMQNILAAFGDDALDMLDDDDDFSFPGDAELQPEPRPAVLPEHVSNSLRSDELCDQLARKYGERINDDSSLAYAGSIAMACSRAVEAPTRVDSRGVVFETGGQMYGFPLECVIEIARCGHLTALPRTPRWLCGVTNLRGQIFSVIDLGKLLLPGPIETNGQPAGTGTGMTGSGIGKLIFVRGNSQQMCTAILVERVIGIRGFTKTNDDGLGHSRELASICGGVVTVDSRDPSRNPTSGIALVDSDKLLASTTLMRD